MLFYSTMTEAYVENKFDIVISNKRCYKVGWIQSDLDGLNALQASFFLADRA